MQSSLATLDIMNWPEHYEFISEQVARQSGGSGILRISSKAGKFPPVLALQNLVRNQYRLKYALSGSCKELTGLYHHLMIHFNGICLHYIFLNEIVTISLAKNSVGRDVAHP